MSFDNCVDNAVSGKEITEEQGEKLKRLYNAQRREAMRNGASDAEIEAQRLTAMLLEQDKGRARVLLAKQLKVLREMDRDLGNDVGRAAAAKIAHLGQREYGFSSVEGRAKAIIGMATGRMSALMEANRKRFFSLTGRRGSQMRMINVAKEAFGDDTKDGVAKAWAQAWMDTVEWLRRRANSAGAGIKRLENWGLPQTHSPLKLLKAEFPEWYEFIEKRLDWNKMRNPITDAPIPQEERLSVLRSVFDTITSNGRDKRAPTLAFRGRGMLANQRMEHRFLQFNSADEWLQYHERFGDGDVMQAMMDHIRGMADDIAQLEILGPNPNGMVNWMGQMVQREADKASRGEPSRFKPHGLGYKLAKTQNKGAAMQRAGEGEVTYLNDLWDIQSGTGVVRSAASGNAGRIFGALGSASRTFLGGGALGSAFLSAFGDTWMQKTARQMMGNSAFSMVGDILRSFGKMSREEANAAYLLNDDALYHFSQATRYLGADNVNTVAHVVADRVLTWSFLTPWTAVQRRAMGMGSMEHFARQMGKSFAALPDETRRMLRTYGIDGDDWDKMRAINAYTRDGVAIMRPKEIADAGHEELATTYLEMILQHMEYATPTNSTEARFFMDAGTRAGTVSGELTRSFAMFKSYPTMLLVTHGRRLGADIVENTNKQRGKTVWRATQLFVGMTLFGALSIQLKNLSAGRDLENMENLKFWGAAIAQGGGLGILGDFFFSTVNRYGGGIGGFFAGRQMEWVGDTIDLTAGNIIELARGDDTHFARELVRWAKNTTPGSNIWYLKAVIEREIWDNLRMLADPEAARAFRQSMQTRKREYGGQEYWWPMGRPAPGRMPQYTPAPSNP